MKIVAKFALALVVPLGLSIFGCSSKSEPKSTEPAHEEHEHASTGPHGGELIEMGEEEYHAELMHKTDVVVYLLDGTAKTQVPVANAQLTLNVSHDGANEQFPLAPQHDAADPEGKASKFVSQDAELAKDLAEGHAEVQLVVTIGEKQFRGALQHEHEGASHEH